jgi:hypothetical protein
MTNHERLLRRAARYVWQIAPRDRDAILQALEHAIDMHRYQRWAGTQGIYAFRPKPRPVRLPRAQKQLTPR